MYVDQPDGSEREVATLPSGKFFGERALLTKEPANATVRAHGEVECYTCSRARFRQHFGSLQDLLDEEAERRELKNRAPPPPLWTELETNFDIAQGAFGLVRLVTHTRTKKQFALKVFVKQRVLQAGAAALKTVIAEQNIMQSLDHPLALQLVQCYQSHTMLYMLLELAPGGEVASLLGEPLPELVSKFYVASAVLILGHLHRKRIVYRDLKPENMLLDAQGYVKLADYGFAKWLKGKSYTLCGTPEYLAPELLANTGHGFPVDWWAVGVLAFECLAGVTPFYDENPMVMCSKINECKIAWDNAPKNLSPSARQFIESLLRVNQLERLGNPATSAADVKEASWLETIQFKKLEAMQLPVPYFPENEVTKPDVEFEPIADLVSFPQSDPAFSLYSGIWVDDGLEGPPPSIRASPAITSTLPTVIERARPSIDEELTAAGSVLVQVDKNVPDDKFSPESNLPKSYKTAQMFAGQVGSAVLGSFRKSKDRAR